MIHLSTKRLFIFLNTILLLAAHILLITGASLLGSLRHSTSLLNRYISVPASLTVAFGALLFCLSLFSYLCIFCENITLLVTFLILLLTLVIVELAVGITGLVNKFHILTLINNLLRSVEPNYTSDSLAARTWDDLQQNLKCCGVYNYTEWFQYSGNSSLPDSCCSNYTVNCGSNAFATGNIYLSDCAFAIENWVVNHQVLASIFFSLLVCVKILTLLVGYEHKKLLSRRDYAKVT